MLEYKAKNETTTITAKVTAGSVVTASYGGHEFAHLEQYRIRRSVQFGSDVARRFCSKLVIVVQFVVITSFASATFAARARHGSEAGRPAATS